MLSQPYHQCKHNMGRFVKNKELHSGSYSIRLPVGSSAVGPNSPVDGLVRYSKTTRRFEYFSAGSWHASAIVGNVHITKDTFYGNGNDQVFGPMQFSYVPGEEAIIFVFVGNIFQNPGVAFYFVDNDPYNITFTSPPPEREQIIILHGYASTNAYSGEFDAI